VREDINLLTFTRPFKRYHEQTYTISGCGIAISEGVEKGIIETGDYDDEFGSLVYANLNQILLANIVDNFQTYLVDLLVEIFTLNPQMITAGKI